MEILFVTEASDLIGIGHLSRCLSIAEVFRKNSHEVKFYLRSNSNSSSNLLKEKGFEVCKSLEDLPRSNAITEIPNKIVFLDLSGSGFSSEIDELRMLGYLICLIDESDPTRLDKSDLHFMMPTARSNVNYRGTEFIGWDWIPLKLDVTNQRAISITSKQGRYIVINFGGADPGELTELFCANLSFIHPRQNVVVICGPYVSLSRVSRIKSLVFGMPNVKVEHDPGNYAEICAGAVLGIIAFGVSFYEFLYYQIPTVSIYRNASEVNSLVPIADSMGTVLLSEIEYRDVFKSGIQSSILETRIHTAVDESSMSKIKNGIVLRPDGNGTENIYRSVIDYLARMS